MSFNAEEKLISNCHIASGSKYAMLNFDMAAVLMAWLRCDRKFIYWDIMFGKKTKFSKKANFSKKTDFYKALNRKTNRRTFYALTTKSRHILLPVDNISGVNP